MMAKIRDVILITTFEDQPHFINLLGDGKNWGINIEYVVQERPNGIAEAFLLCEDLIKNEDKVCLILGDNIFHGSTFIEVLIKAKNDKGASIFASEVHDPQRYGVIEFDEKGIAISIEEKPNIPKSNFAVTGIYFYDNNVIDLAKQLAPSYRGELEISDLNRSYLEQGRLTAHVLPRGTAWFDTGTFNSMHDASAYIRALEERQGFQIGCLEEISLNNKWISKQDVLNHIAFNNKSELSTYLSKILTYLPLI
jgi:glucose-1-phosphate thymidylyltransferase